MIRSFQLLHDYFIGSGCGNSYSSRWLRLTELRAHAVEGGAYHAHTFSYDASTVPPCRDSPAQDHWGYYNGATSNTSLIPTAIIPGTSPPVVIHGADRQVNPAYSQFGILTRINYPTGGYTDFVYENNDVKQGSVYNYRTVSAVLLGETPITTDTYSRNFVIDNPPDENLNGNHISGGAFIAGAIGNLGCELDGMADPCAVLTIESLTPGLGVFLLVSSDFHGYYIPNGTYKMTASFDQTPPGYDSYWFNVSWKERNPAPGGNQLVGGLRVKETHDHDPISGSTETKRYWYLEATGSPISSGMLHAADRLNYSELVTHFNDGCEALYFRLVSYSTQEQATYQGAYVGYGAVTVESHSPEMTGVAVYRYSQQADVVSNPNNPYPPPHSLEGRRGNLLEEGYYKVAGGQYVPVRKTTYGYLHIDEPQEANLMLKIAPNPGLPTSAYGMTFADYTIRKVWTGMSEKMEREYDQTDTTVYTERVTEYEYHPVHRQLIAEDLLGSDGKIRRTEYRYPPDLTLSGVPEAGRKWLVDQNVLTPVLRQYDYVGVSELIGELHTNYRMFDGANRVYPFEVIEKTRYGDPDRIRNLVQYTGRGRLTSQSITDGLLTSYLWNSAQNYPLAEVRNAALSDIAYTSFEDDAKGNWAYAGSPQSDVLAVTGNYVYPLTDGPVSRSGLNSSLQYVLTYWVKGNVAPSVSGGTVIPALSGAIRTYQGWTQFRRTFSGTTAISISGSMQLDELRLHPSQAEMDSYTFVDLVGLSSRTDAGGNTHYYTYDRFRRLHSIRDLNGNMLQNFCYHFAGHLVDCNEYIDIPPVDPPPPSTQFHYLYSSSIAVICDNDPGTLIPIVTVYRQIDNSLYYSDVYCTVLVTDGYYKPADTSNYLFIANGGLSFTGVCP